MKKINLGNLIEAKQLDRSEIAKQLFPNNKYPDRALARVLDGSALLDSDQISKLSSVCNIPINGLFEGGEWVDSLEADNLVFTKGDYKAEYSMESGVTKIYHLKSLMHESMIVGRAITLAEYLNKIESIIINLKEDETNRN